MNPIYKFELEAGGANRHQVYPVFKDDLAIDFAKESQQEFFRRKLSGKLTFLSDDYVFISSTVFDTKFGLFLSISYDLGQNWIPYWQGEFWKTDCEFSEDDQTCIVSPAVVDGYTNILNGQDKEYDLITLAPEIVPVKYDKRPFIQIYRRGDNTVGCWMGGIWWEQECEPITDGQELDDMHFSVLVREQCFNLDGVTTPQVPDVFYGVSWYQGGVTLPYTYVNGEWGLKVSFDSGTLKFYVLLSKNGVNLWEGVYDDFTQVRYLTPISGSGATGTIAMTTLMYEVGARIVCDVYDINGVATYPIMSNDALADNRNYTRCVGYTGADMVVFTDNRGSTPTEYGLYQPGIYYQPPVVAGYYGKFYPCGKKDWSRISMWFQPNIGYDFVDLGGRGGFILNDAYPLASCISVLLQKIAPEITFGASEDYSEFLFGASNPITLVQQYLFLTPKSNVINSGYSQPAQKAPITLKTIFDMLRDCFRCYWFVENGKLRIEHISYFMRGGSYTGTPVVGRDLTQEEVTRNGKKWAYGKNTFTFNKPDTAGRYQFGWMDDVTWPFEGFPIDIISGYVDKSKIEQVSVSNITSDMDYILISPSDISQDGFVLLAAVLNNGQYELPYKTFTVDNTDVTIQNAYAAFIFLQNYYLYDMPAPLFEINGEQRQAVDTRRLKLQDIQFPCLVDPDTKNLIKTGLGFGMLEKISVNLSSRNGKATLKLPTE